jgi:hypothetical protein
MREQKRESRKFVQDRSVQAAAGSFEGGGPIVRESWTCPECRLLHIEGATSYGGAPSEQRLAMDLTVVGGHNFDCNSNSQMRELRRWKWHGSSGLARWVATRFHHGSAVGYGCPSDQSPSFRLKSILGETLWRQGSENSFLGGLV